MPRADHSFDSLPLAPPLRATLQQLGHLARAEDNVKTLTLCGGSPIRN